MARFGFTALRPVEPVEADMSRMVDPAAIQAKREITPAKMRLESPTFRPGINDKPAEAYSPSFLQVLDRVLGGDTITEARRNLITEDQATKQKAASLAEVRSLMGQVLTDPRERLAYLANPEEWVKAVATNYAAANVGGGDTRVMPHYGSVTAPKVIESGDSIISATPDDMTVLGRREPSYKEKVDADIKERLAEIRELLGKSKIARDAALTSQGERRLGQGDARLSLARQKAGGRSAAPISRRVLGSALPEGY